ncbi:DNA methyltransferase [uncultured Paenibacillus sp.]|uniref:DNA-methyltransferase n=1 Tax=uncultured Paenibacillus sp. TaxID=227322 RepID=UPI0015AF3265|nr:DNA methyltransferase [uncultured Paenibacillus sp.]DAW22591.1 MAG TPA: adenine-specific methyltransferase [Caudoviricetes sp.]
MTKINTVICGDSAEVLRQYPDNFFDSVVCDPPYGLSKEPDIAEVLTKWLAGEPYDHGHGGFMGKSWDSFVPHPDLWREVFRVLKPGGHALVFAGTRTQDLMTIALRLGGFEIRDVIEWLYFSGFPKSMDVGKAFDRRRDEDKEHRVKVTSWVSEQCKANGWTRLALCEVWGVKNQPIQSWTETNADYAVIPTWENWTRLKDVVGFGDEMDAEVWRLNGRKGKPGDAWEGAEVIGEYEGTPGGFGEYRFSVSDSFMRAPATELARKWNGWGTALKPAHEPIIVARKPLVGTVAETVEKYGTGAINIDGCRIGRADGERTEYGVTGDEGSPSVNTFGQRERVAYTPDEAGRFPANCITTDVDAFYSPYFRVDAATAQPNVSPADLSKKATKRDRNQRVDGAPSPVPNVHPTVKPVALMAWLITLVTPPGGTVLDPFAGSGTTLVAAKREGFGFVGIEREPDYVKIAQARVGIEAEGGAAA